MAKKQKSEILDSLQNNPDVVILNNPMATPSFIRQLSKSKKTDVNEIYTPKLFYEIASRLKPSDLENMNRNTNVVLTLEIKEFLHSIQTKNTSGYSYLIDSIKMLQTTLVEWFEGKEHIIVPIVTQSVHVPESGKIDLYVANDLARQILQVKEVEHFSFFKKNVFALQTTRAIKLFPYFSSWKNYGRHVDVDLRAFKEKLGFDKSVYARFSSFKKNVLDPGIAEINEKTDLLIKYELIGEGLDTQKPRIKALRFLVYEKSNQKQLAQKSKEMTEQIITNIDKFIEVESEIFMTRFFKHSQEFYDRLLSDGGNRNHYLQMLEQYQGTNHVSEFNMFVDSEFLMKEFIRKFPHHAESMRTLSAMKNYIEKLEQKSKELGFLLLFELDDEFQLKIIKL